VGARFSVPVNTSTKAHLTSCIMGTRSFCRRNWLGHCADHPLLVALRLQMGWIYISSSPLCLCRLVLLWSLPLQQSHMIIIWESVYQVSYCTNSFSTVLNIHIAHLQQQCHNSKFVIFQDTVPVKSASVNISFYTNNSKMPNFELWHSCCKWAILNSTGSLWWGIWLKPHCCFEVSAASGQDIGNFNFVPLYFYTEFYSEFISLCRKLGRKSFLYST